jgi:hypothetical protein
MKPEKDINNTDKETKRHPERKNSNIETIKGDKKEEEKLQLKT